MIAAAVNAASSHFAEQDDVHNSSVFHPAAVVIPPALAVAQAIGASGRDLVTAIVAGYEVGIRVGEFLGRSHYRIFHTTGTAGTVAAAAAVGRLLGLTGDQMQHAFGSAGTQAAGLWEFLRDAADSKQLHCAHAAASGLAAAHLAHKGLTGARRIFEGPQGMAAGMSTDSDPARLVDRLGARWALAETSFKFHASCRHTHPAADALLSVMTKEQLKADHVARVTARVHKGAIDVLGPVTDPQTVHQSKFSMGTVLGLIAIHGRAALTDFDRDFRDPKVMSFRERVHMELDPEVDSRLPRTMDRQGHGGDDRRAPPRGPRRCAEGRSRQHARAARTRGQGDPTRHLPQRRLRSGDARGDRADLGPGEGCRGRALPGLSVPATSAGPRPGLRADGDRSRRGTGELVHRFEVGPGVRGNSLLSFKAHARHLECDSRRRDRRQARIMAASASQHGGEDEADGEANPERNEREHHAFIFVPKIADTRAFRCPG